MALQYELEVLENFVAKTLHPARLKQTDSIVSQIPQWRELIASETDRIRKQFIHTVFNSKERQRELYIQHHQVQLIRMADQLFQYLAVKNPKSIYQTGRDNLIATIYKETFRCTEELLNYIEQYFTSYFDKEADVPRVYLLLNQRSLRSSIKALRLKLAELNANADFIDVLIAPMSAFCQKKRASYRELIYIKDILRALTACEAISELKNLLVSMNFNSCTLVSQWIGEMVNMLNSLPETKDRTAQLSKWQKEINQIPVKPNVALKPNCVSLRDQLSQWITEEIQYLETRQRLLSVAPSFKASSTVNDEEKLQFSVSVNVLAILIRAAHESKLILNKHGTTVFNTVSKFSSTVQTKNPGAKSMDKKSHDPERSHKAKAISALQDMIRLIQDY
jgi:hypothetical protein